MKKLETTKKSWGMLGTIIAIVGISMVVAAAGLVVSNVLTGGNVVPPADEGATLSFVDSPVNFPGSVDWVNGGDAVIGQSYSLGVRLEGNADYSNLVVDITVSKLGIAPSDVSLQYYDGEEWWPLTFSAGTNDIHATFGPASGFAITDGYDQTTPMVLTYNVAGTYAAELVVLTA